MREYAAPLKDAGGRHRDPRLHALPADPARSSSASSGEGSRSSSPRRRSRARSSETLARKGVENDEAREGGYRFLTTGDPVQFREMGRRFLQLPIASAEHVEVAALEAAAA